MVLIDIDARFLFRAIYLCRDRYFRALLKREAATLFYHAATLLVVVFMQSAAVISTKNAVKCLFDELEPTHTFVYTERI